MGSEDEREGDEQREERRQKQQREKGKNKLTSSSDSDDYFDRQRSEIRSKMIKDKPIIEFQTEVKRDWDDDMQSFD